MRSNLCRYCGEQFSVFKRQDAEFCSDRCKQAQYRLRKAAAEAAAPIESKLRAARRFAAAKMVELGITPSDVPPPSGPAAIAAVASTAFGRLKGKKSPRPAKGGGA